MAYNDGKQLYFDGQYIARLEGITTGSSMTSRIQTLLNNPKCKEIVFDLGDILLSGGTISCGGKKLTFKNRSKFIGTHTLDGGVLDCALSDQCFTTGTTLTNFSSVRDEFTCENYGALGAGADETGILQKTSDTLIANTKMPRVIKMFSNRTYGTRGWIWHNWNGSDYGQYSISLIGEPSTMGGNSSFSPTLNCLNPNGFGIAIQRVTGATVRGIAFSGQLNIPAVVSYEEFYTRDYATFASANGVRDSRFSPNAAIVIDPFRQTNTLPSDNGYPGYNGLSGSTNWYRGTGGGNTSAGSTAVMIEDVVIGGFTVGVMVSPNGETQQGENTVIRNITCNNVKAVTGWGQRETKGCLLNIGYSYDRVYNILDGDSWGNAQGTLPDVDRYTTSGTIVQFLRGSAQHPVQFKGIYTETNYRIGDFNGNAGMVSFVDCNFVFNTGLNPYVIPPSHFSGQNIHFEGCTIRYYDDLFNKRLVFIGDGYTFNKCNFDLPPIGSVGVAYPGTQRLNSIICTNCYYNSGSLFGVSTLKGYFQARNDYSVACGHITIENQSETPYGRMLQTYECGGFDILQSVFATGSFTANTVTKTATFNGSSIDITPGQYILYLAGTGSTFSILGRVSSVNLSNNNISLVDVPVGVLSGVGTTAFYGISDYQRFRGRFTGIYTFNSPTITSVFGDPTIGEKDAYTGAVILSADSVAKTVTLTRGVLNTASVSPELYTPATQFGTELVKYNRNALPTDSFYFTDTTKYFPGDIWIYVPSYYGITSNIGDVRTFKCTVSGYISPATIGQTKQSQWIEIFDSNGPMLTTGGTFTNNKLILTNNTGGTVSTVINNFTGLTVNGVISATTVSATTFFGSGANLTGLLANNERITGGSFTNNTLTLTNTTGGTVSTVINNFTGLTVNGAISATTVSATTFFGNGSYLNGIASGYSEVIFTTTGSSGTTAVIITPTQLTNETLTVEVECNSKLTTGLGGYYTKKSQSFDWSASALTEFDTAAVDIIADRYKAGISAATISMIASANTIMIRFSGEAGKTIRTKIGYRVLKTN